MNEQFFNDPAVRGYFADLVRQSGYGMWDTESAAFLIRDENGDVRCAAWPAHAGYRRQEFRGAFPDRAVAIVHTHPQHLPLASIHDRETAVKWSVPMFVLTPRSIYLITTRGEIVTVVEKSWWIDVSASSSRRCSAPGSRASRRR
jgi:proteasome lid subunit RPN8/RPN11